MTACQSIYPLPYIHLFAQGRWNGKYFTRTKNKKKTKQTCWLQTFNVCYFILVKSLCHAFFFNLEGQNTLHEDNIKP